MVTQIPLRETHWWRGGEVGGEGKREERSGGGGDGSEASRFPLEGGAGRALGVATVRPPSGLGEGSAGRGEGRTDRRGCRDESLARGRWDRAESVETREPRGTKVGGRKRERGGGEAGRGGCGRPRERRMVTVL